MFSIPLFKAAMRSHFIFHSQIHRTYNITNSVANDKTNRHNVISSGQES